MSAHLIRTAYVYWLRYCCLKQSRIVKCLPDAHSSCWVVGHLPSLRWGHTETNLSSRHKGLNQLFVERRASDEFLAGGADGATSHA
jgi:hypothetical protein